MTKDDAKLVFLRLVNAYGLRWTANVPREAYEQMAEISKVLSSDDKRVALLGR